MTKLRFLLSGPGLIGRQHARLINSRNDCELAAVVAPSSEHNVATANQIGVPLYSDIDAALSSEQIDAVVISSPNAFHFEQAMSCVAARVPALVEKPVTSSLDEARRLADAAEKFNLAILVGHHRTYSPLLWAAKSFIDSERFGRLVAAQGTALFYKPAKYFQDGPWRARQGGGPILINLIHEIGLLRYLCGE